MNVQEVLEAIKALPPGDMKAIVTGVKEILYEKKVCSTCGDTYVRTCWACYESGPYDRV